MLARAARAAVGMTQNNDETSPKTLRGELDASDLRGGDDVSRYPDHEQVAQTLVEDDCNGHTGIGATEMECRFSHLLAGEFPDECRHASQVVIVMLSREDHHIDHAHRLTKPGMHRRSLHAGYVQPLERLDESHA